MSLIKAGYVEFCSSSHAAAKAPALVSSRALIVASREAM